MRVLNDKFCLTPSLREHLERRMQLSFSGVHDNILLVAVRLRDLNGPRGGSDMMCQLLITVPGCPQIVVNELQEDMRSAIDAAARRAAHRVSRVIALKRLADRPCRSAHCRQSKDTEEMSHG
ncbi:MAG: HPF/RaiA family ribosome-associated protein [Burkholderiaceae bacterium]